jgi:hypothetical protein
MTTTVPRVWVPIVALPMLKRRTYVIGGRVRILWRGDVPASSLVEFV